MHNSVKVLCFLLVKSTLLCAFTRADVCVKKSSCICEFANGTGIDLTPSAKSTFYIVQKYDVKKSGAQYSLSTYYYHPCFDAVPNVNETVANNTCTTALSICRHVNNMDLINNTTGTFKIDSGIYEYMGTSNNTEFKDDGQSIIYHNGPSGSMKDKTKKLIELMKGRVFVGDQTERQLHRGVPWRPLQGTQLPFRMLYNLGATTVLLICAQTDDQLMITSTEEPNNVVLSFYSRYACLRQIEAPGRSFGSTLLIIFFSFVVFYLVLGICTKKFLMGATGIEVIPNLGFWTDLPNLVKDGWAFMINGFKLPVRGGGPVTSPDPNSYDSI